MVVNALLQNTFPGVTPLAQQRDAKPAQVQGVETAKWRTKSSENVALKPLGLETRPFARNTDKVEAANGIDLVDKNSLKLVEGIGRPSQDVYSPRACERCLRVEEQIRECLPDRASMLKVFCRGFHIVCEFVRRSSSAIARCCKSLKGRHAAIGPGALLGDGFERSEHDISIYKAVF